MRSKNDVELEMKLKRYRQLASRVTDEEFAKGIAQRIAKLERKLREIDE